MCFQSYHDTAFTHFMFIEFKSNPIGLFYKLRFLKFTFISGTSLKICLCIHVCVFVTYKCLPHISGVFFFFLSVSDLGVILDNYDPSDMDAGKQTQVLWEKRKHS